jgi:hypothetical protein
VSDKVQFTDSQGIAWAVREESVESEVEQAGGRAPRGSCWLSFETELEVRRLWNYPDDWRRLTDWQLDALRRRASTVIARFPRAPRAAVIGQEDGRPAGPTDGRRRD